jgi:hypothetical protein
MYIPTSPEKHGGVRIHFLFLSGTMKKVCCQFTRKNIVVTYYTSPLTFLTNRNGESP